MNILYFDISIDVLMLELIICEYEPVEQVYLAITPSSACSFFAEKVGGGKILP
jgi:hypothetical protein